MEEDQITKLLEINLDLLKLIEKVNHKIDLIDKKVNLNREQINLTANG